MDIPENLYQPIPFEGYEQYDCNASRTRKDCESRFQIIKKHLVKNFGSLKGLSLVDIGCANGYLPFRFIQEGGELARGVETEPEIRDFTNALAEESMVNFKVAEKVEALDQGQRFEVGIYFDLHFHERINLLHWIGPRVDILFASCSGDGNSKNKPMLEDLKKHYSDIEVVGFSISNRAIYLCTGPLNKIVGKQQPPQVPVNPEPIKEQPAPQPAQPEGAKNENSDPSA